MIRSLIVLMKIFRIKQCYGQTDGQTDGQRENSIPKPLINFV